MRHRRLKQCITYKYGKNRDSKYIYRDKKRFAIKCAKQIGESISTMQSGKLHFESEGVLDPTFKWHRKYNNVSYGNGDSQVFIDIYRDSVYW
ncbi:hypothetical protein [Bacillus thuringiensis]|uniref:hypothetical protein n=1 Tax=Bacillus thuringiensis TaxID=1428 RepID=UPI002E17D4EF|nr:hypothetical protein [Bacillus thuringiensis]